MQDDVDITATCVDKNFSSYGKCKFVISRVSPMKLGDFRALDVCLR